MRARRCSRSRSVLVGEELVVEVRVSEDLRMVVAEVVVRSSRVGGELVDGNYGGDEDLDVEER